MGRGIVLVLSGIAAVLALSVVLTVAPAALRDGIVATFTILSAAGTAAAAWAAFRSASASSDAARNALRALALHRRNNVVLALYQDYGREDGDWVWIATLGSWTEDSPSVTSVQVDWSTDGVRHRQVKPALAQYEPWKFPAHLPGSVDRHDVHRHLSQAVLTWRDAHGYTSWRRVVDVQQSTLDFSPGTYLPAGMDRPNWDDQPWAPTIPAQLEHHSTELL